MKILVFIISILTLYSCSDRQSFSDYKDINDSSGNLSYKFNSNDSTAIIFSEYGKTYMKGKLVNGKREGIWSEYVFNGNWKSYEYTFKDDVENGKCYSFTITGKIDLVGNRKDGTLDGMFVYFDLKGNPEKVELWKEFDNGSGVSNLAYTKDLRVK